MNLMELFGYLSSIVVLISLTMNSIIKLRWINMIGSLMFTIYSLYVRSLPTAFLNLGIVCINLYYLYKLYTTKEEFKLIEAEKDSKYLNYFLEINEKELKEFGNATEWKQDEKVFYMLRNNNTAGILAGKEDKETLFINIDFVTSKYRDMKLGKYFFHENKNDLKNLGYKKLISKGINNKHIDYLEKIGFVKISEDLYQKEL